MPAPALILHGGAGDPDPSEHQERQAAVQRSLEAGWARIGAGALEAVVAAVRALEDEPILNAGIGACLNREGDIELDAGVMDGDDRRAGAVGAVRDVRHPVDLARAVMDDGRHVLLVADGASQFARSAGVEMADPSIFRTERQQRNWERLLAREADTVGAVARDAEGHLAAAVSTGGVTGKLPGRLGDSPVPGAGFYAQDGAGAACATGQGEGFLRLVLCHLAVVEMEHGLAPDYVARGALEHLARRTGLTGGIILVGPDGDPAFAHSTSFMPVAVRVG